MEQRSRRCCSPKGSVVADIDPGPAGVGLALRQDRHRRVVAVKPLRREHMPLDQCVQRTQRRRARPDLVGQRRQTEIDAFPGVAFALPVQRLMLTELLEQHHGKQVRAGEAARCDMERRRRLGDRLALPARELLAHCLDDLPLTRDHLQRLGDVLAQLRQPGRSAAGAVLRRGDDDALTRQVLRERLARRPPAFERANRLHLSCCLLGGEFILGGIGFQILELKLHLLKQPGLAL